MSVSLTPGERREVTLFVERSAAVPGRVLDEAGRGVPGALVVAWSDIARNWPGADHRGPSAATDAKGRFLVEGLVFGERRTFLVSAPGKATRRLGPLLVRRGLELEFRVKEAAFEEILVLDAMSGVPIPGARVTLHAPSRPGPPSWERWFTDSEGRARVGPLPEVEFRLFVLHPDYAPPSDYLGVKSPVRLQPGLKVEGTVQFPNGRPAVGTVVTWFDVGPDRVRNEGWWKKLHVGDDGSFVVPGLASGDVNLGFACHIDGTSLGANRTIEAGTTGVHVRLASDDSPSEVDRNERPTLTIRVTDANGRVVPQATALIEVEEPMSRWGVWFPMEVRVVNGVGNYEIDWPRVNAVEIHGAMDAWGQPLPLGTQRVSVPRDAREIEVRLPPEQTMEGVVLDPDGRGLRGVRVSARAHGHSHWTECVSDRKGRFRVVGLGAGDHELEFNPSPPLLRAELPLTPSGTRGLTVRLRRGVAATLRVLDPDGKPVAGAVVTAWAGGIDHPVARGEAGVDGYLMLPPLNPDRRYRLELSPPYGSRDLADHVIAPWTPDDGEVSFRHAR